MSILEKLGDRAAQDLMAARAFRDLVQLAERSFDLPRLSSEIEALATRYATDDRTETGEHVSREEQFRRELAEEWACEQGWDDGYREGYAQGLVDGRREVTTS